ncbi:hypothetical protein T484DRAFT_1897869, partial [Baffinella frigidus]
SNKPTRTRPTSPKEEDDAHVREPQHDPRGVAHQARTGSPRLRVAQRLLRRERRAVEAHQDTPWLEEHLRRRRAAVGKAPCGPAPSTRAHDHLAALHGGVGSRGTHPCSHQPNPSGARTQACAAAIRQPRRSPQRPEDLLPGGCQVVRDPVLLHLTERSCGARAKRCNKR